jgi:hypothetical protein
MAIAMDKLDQARQETRRYLEAFALGQVTPDEIYMFGIHKRGLLGEAFDTLTPDSSLRSALDLIDDFHDAGSAADYRIHGRYELESIIRSL